MRAHAGLSGLAGYWPFNEAADITAADLSGSGNHGTLSGGPTWVDGQVGKALLFDGTNDYVEVGDPAAGTLDFDETQSFSFGAWIKPAVIDNVGRRFISKRTGSENIGFELGVWGGSEGVFAELSDGTNERSTADYFDIPVTVGEWSFVLAVVNRAEATLRVYVNGIETPMPLDISGVGSLASTAPLNFGRASGNSAKSFAGVLDEVRIYSRALSVEEVQELFTFAQAPLSFTSQPTNQRVEEGLPASFSASFSGSPPYFVQWFKDGAAIEGATNATYTIASTTLDLSGSAFSVTVSNLLPSAITSTNAILTVAHDLTPPTLSGAFARYFNQVVVGFSEPVSAVTAEDPGNYVVTDAQGEAIPVDVAVLRASDGLGVTLTLASPLSEGTDYHLAVYGIEDLAAPANVIVEGGARAFRFNSLVGYWPFNDASGTTAADLSGYGNPGTLAGGPNWVDGREGKALLFDGTNDYVEVGDPASGVLDFEETQSFSFGAWIKPAILDTTGRRFISKRNGADVGYECSVIKRSGHGFFAELGDGSSAPSSYDAGILVPLTVGEWYHVMTVVDREANELRLYLNGALQGTVNVTGLGSVAIGEALNLGRASGNSAKSFAGVLDEVRIYSRVLTPEEIMAFVPSEFLTPTISEGQIHLNWTGAGQLEWAPTILGPWTAVDPAPLPPYSEEVVPGENRFFRLIVAP